MRIKSLAGLTALVTGAAGGMGRELAVQLAGAGCSVAVCDVRAAPLEATKHAALAVARRNNHHYVRVSAHVVDVSSDASIAALRASFEREHGTKLDLLFNNAGIVSGGSFAEMSRDRWQSVLDVNFHGLVEMTRTFLPLVIASKSGYGSVVNTSSINSFWCCIGPAKWPVAAPPHVVYSASKAAVKGFTEALLHDSRANFPHVNIVNVMPGHVGTDIAALQVPPAPPSPSGAPAEGGAADPASARLAANWDARLAELRTVTHVLTRGEYSSEALDAMDADELVEIYGARFRDDAPLSASDAAEQIIAAVVRGETRVLVGEDAVVIDWLARAFPQLVYKDWFIVGVLAPWSLSAAKIGRKYRGRYWYPAAVAAMAYAAKCVAARGVRSLRSRL